MPDREHIESVSQRLDAQQREIEQLRARCAALAYLHYGHYLVQRTPESVRADIEACESALTALRRELAAMPVSPRDSRRA
jgi:hypothetical protein